MVLSLGRNGMVRWHRRVVATLGGVVVVGLTAGMVPQAVADPTTPSPTAPVVSSPAAAVPSPTPTSSPSAGTGSSTIPDYLRTKVTVDKKSTISVNVATGAVSVRFRSGVTKKRPVSLQRLVDGAWEQVTKKKMDAKGRVTFSAGTYQSNSIYRAVELRYKIKKKWASLRATKTAGWQLTFEDLFGDTEVDGAKWSLREWANKGPRYCSRTSSQMYEVTDGSLVASVAYMADKGLAAEYHANALKVQKQGCWWGWENSPTGYGVYDTAMITTEGHYVVNTAKPGGVAARLRYPDAQGMHGAVWLKSPGKGEIDITEGFGYGLGISNYIHTPSKKTLNATGPASHKLGAYVIPKQTKMRSWWAKYHTYSIDWTSTGFTFRVDGKITQKVKIKPGNVDYSLIVSLLVSDWEANRITHPIMRKGFKDVTPSKLPVRMDVDWVKVWTKA
jgi:hypothetical protein